MVVALVVGVLELGALLVLVFSLWRLVLHLCPGIDLDGLAPTTLAIVVPALALLRLLVLLQVGFLDLLDLLLNVDGGVEVDARGSAPAAGVLRGLHLGHSLLK